MKFSHGHIDQSLLTLLTKFLGRNNGREKTIYLQINNPSSFVININAINNGIDKLCN